jgi:hypothetical protein
MNIFSNYLENKKLNARNGKSGMIMPQKKITVLQRIIQGIFPFILLNLSLISFPIFKVTFLLLLRWRGAVRKC